jgi:hypothetical protein
MHFANRVLGPVLRVIPLWTHEVGLSVAYLEIGLGIECFR